MAGPVRRALAAAVGLAALVAACSSGSGAGGGPESPPASVSATAGPNASPPAQPAEQCGGGPALPAESFWLSGARGAQLAAATVGTGSDVAIFVHESGMSGLCGFWPYAVWLARGRHLRAVLFDQCGYGASFCEKDSATEPEDWITSTKAAVAWARAHGARRVTVVGASAGGIVALHAAASIQPAVDAVVDLSGELTWSGLDSLTAARTLTVPVLYAVAPHDEYVTVADMRRIYAATGSRSKRLVQAESGHGWEMLTTPSRTGWSPLAAQAAAIIQGTHR
jgi:hypothetical protein